MSAALRSIQWPLQHMTSASKSVEFFESVKKGLSVYSPSVCQIYGAYDHYQTHERKAVRKPILVILPDFLRHTEQFIGIESEAIKPTGVCLFPHHSQPGLILMRIRMRARESLTLPADKGFEFILQRKSDFTPLLIRGSLRELPANATPFLQLHHVDLSVISHKSAFFRAGFADYAIQKLSHFSQSR